MRTDNNDIVLWVLGVFFHSSIASLAREGRDETLEVKNRENFPKERVDDSSRFLGEERESETKTK